MSKVEEIVAIVEKESPGLLGGISREDGITKESLVRKVLALSHGQMVRTHQSEAPSGKEFDDNRIASHNTLRLFRQFQDLGLL